MLKRPLVFLGFLCANLAAEINVPSSPLLIPISPNNGIPSGNFERVARWRQDVCMLPANDYIPNCWLDLKQQRKDSQRKKYVADDIRTVVSLQELEKNGIVLTDDTVQELMSYLNETTVNPKIKVDVRDSPYLVILVADKCLPHIGVPFCSWYEIGRLLINPDRDLQMPKKLKVYELSRDGIIFTAENGRLVRMPFTYVYKSTEDSKSDFAVADRMAKYCGAIIDMMNSKYPNPTGKQLDDLTSIKNQYPFCFPF